MKTIFFGIEYNNIDIFSTDDKTTKDVNIISLHIKKSEEQSPLFTIAIPTFKRANTLKDALNSALAQKTDIPYEVIVVDNNPKRNDETEILLKEYCQPNLSYYKNTENLGMFGNWNRMISLSKAPWIVMLHDDDILFDNYIKEANKYISRNIDFISFNMQIFNEKLPPRKTVTDIVFRRLKLSDCCTSNPIHIAGCLMRKQAVITLGGFDDRIYPTSDYAFWANLIARKKAYICNQNMAYYRIENNASTKSEVMSKMERDISFISLQVLKRMRVPYCLAKFIQLSPNEHQINATKKQFIHNYTSDFLAPYNPLEMFFSKVLCKVLAFLYK